MKKSNAEPVGKLLGVLLDELGLGKKLKQYEAVRVWQDVVGEKIAKCCHSDEDHQWYTHRES